MRRFSLRPAKRVLLRALLVFALAGSMGVAPRALAVSSWIGVDQGDWFEGERWDPVGVPGEKDNAAIANGNEATATAATAPGDVVAKDIRIGGPLGGGLAVDGVSVDARDDIRVGMATGQDDDVVTTAESGARIYDASQITTGGDLPIGRAVADDQAVVSGLGRVEIGRITSITVAANVDIGPGDAGSSSQALGFGELTLSDVGTIWIGGNIEVAKANTENTPNDARGSGHGSLVAQRIDDITIQGDFEIGESNDPGRATATADLTLSDIGTLRIGEDLEIGKSRASPGGSNESNATAEWLRVDANVAFELAVGRAWAEPFGQATTTAQLRVEASPALLVGFGGLDARNIEVGVVDEVNEGTASATGTLELVDVVEVAVATDLEVGHTRRSLSPTTSSVGTATGTLLGERVDLLEVRRHVNIGGAACQADSIATSEATAELVDVAEFDVARRMLLGGVEATGASSCSASGELLLTNTAAIVGADIEVGVVDAAELAIATSRALLRLADGSSIEAAGPLRLAHLEGDGFSPGSSVEATLSIASSRLVAESLDAAAVAPGAAGTAHSRIELHPGAHIGLTSALTLGGESTLIYHLSRSEAETAMNAWIGAGSAELGGELVVSFEPFPPAPGAEPAAAEQQNFDLIVGDGEGSIRGDFSASSVVGTLPSEAVQAGIVTTLRDGRVVDVYRITLPEPGMALCQLASLLGLAGLRLASAPRPDDRVGERSRPQ